ncbi:hypothetical protein N8I77_002115 [Diaporthe amygdali]|uniref:Uncharacterized protein n=1 Tax=Phomopsis amygdali TaxID=1214568 RepID=A0AAD9SQB0_PHOAM|nr:hypothetical protein N8I77_002115 [Diaporthe amygdali]
MPVVFAADATGSVGGAICRQLRDIGWRYVICGTLAGMLGRVAGKTFSVKFMSEEDIQEAGGTKSPFVMVQLAMCNMARFADERTLGEKWGIAMTRFDGFLEREMNPFQETYAKLG